MSPRSRCSPPCTYGAQSVNFNGPPTAARANSAHAHAPARARRTGDPTPTPTPTPTAPSRDARRRTRACTDTRKLLQCTHPRRLHDNPLQVHVFEL